MFRSTVSHGNSTNSWNTTPRSGPGPVMALPLIVSSPPLGFSKPAIKYRKVDLPQPLGPMIATNSRSWMESVTSSMARTLPKLF